MHKDSPVRATTFYLALVLLLVLVGAPLQQQLGMWGSVITKLVLFLGLAAAFGVFGEHRPVREVLQLRRIGAADALRSLALGLAAAGLAQFMGMLIVEMVRRVGGSMPAYYREMPLAVGLVVLAVLPAVCEEAAFRGFMQRALGPLGAGWAVWLSAVLFGMMHFSVLRLVPLAALGLVFAVGVQRTGSIFPGMIMHLVNNLTALLLSYLVKTEVRLPVWVLLAGTVVLGLAAWGLARGFGRWVEPSGVTPVGPGPVPVGPALLPLLPALALFVWAAVNELSVTFP